LAGVEHPLSAGPLMFFVCNRAAALNWNISMPSSMEAMARAFATSSAQLQPCHLHPLPRFSLRRHRRQAVACSASAVDDADVVDLFDAAKLTVTRPRRSFVRSCSRFRQVPPCTRWTGSWRAAWWLGSAPARRLPWPFSTSARAFAVGL
jgi:hypothetical protein